MNHSTDPFSSYLKGPIKLPNRWVLAPMTTYSSQADGNISEDELPYLRLRAKSGYGMVMTAACKVHWSGKAFSGQWSCESDEFIPSLQRTAEACKAGGGIAVLQIHHGGRQCLQALTGAQPWSASAVIAGRPNAELPRAMTEDEIWEVIQAFGQACRRAQEAGFDGIELHGANTYLIQQFVSPHSNLRTDEWGKDRLKFSREVIKACRASTTLPVGYRLSPEEPETPGIRLADTMPLVDLLVEMGLAWVHVSLRDFAQHSLYGDSEPVLKLIADRIAGRTTVIGGGGIASSMGAAGAMDLGADLVYVARAAISEPDFVNVLRSGREANRVVPAAGAAEILNLPQGLANRIYAVPGWFPVEGGGV